MATTTTHTMVTTAPHVILVLEEKEWIKYIRAVDPLERRKDLDFVPDGIPKSLVGPEELLVGKVLVVGCLPSSRGTTR